MRDAFGVDRGDISKGLPSALHWNSPHFPKMNRPSKKKFKAAWKKNTGGAKIPKGEEITRGDVKLVKPMLKTVKQLSGRDNAYIIARRARQDFGRDAAYRISGARNLYQQEHAQTYVQAGKKAKEYEQKLISKIAMQPVYHGTTKQAAKALMSGKKWNTKGKKHIESEHPNFVFTATQDRRMVANIFGTMRTARSKGAKPGVIRDQPANPDNARVLTYNAVGVKPIRRNDMESVYDARELGRPLASHRIPTRQAIVDNDRKVTEATGLRALDHPDGPTAGDLMNAHSAEAARSSVNQMPKRLRPDQVKGLTRRAKRDKKTWQSRRV